MSEALRKKDYAARAREKVREALTTWTNEPDSTGKIRLVYWIDKIMEEAYAAKAFTHMVQVLNLVMRFGPGEVTRQEIEHTGSVDHEQRVVVLPQTMSQDEWSKKYLKEPVTVEVESTDA